MANKKTKKNRQSAPAKSKNTKNSSTKKVYQDPFLNKEIELSQSPYDVYKDLQEDSEKLLIIREKAELITKFEREVEIVSPAPEVTNTTTIDSETNSVEEAATIGNTTEPENSSQEIKTPLEEAVDAQPISPTDDTISASKPSSNFNSKIYESENKPGIFGQILSVFSSDTFLYGVTLSLVLGVILFFVQGLQPLLLSNYVTQSSLQSRQLLEDYNLKVGQYFSVQSDAAKLFTGFSSGTICNQQPKYTTLQEDVDKVKRAEVLIFPNNNLVKLKTYENFYLEEVEDIYNQLANSYSSSLNEYGQKMEIITQIPEFLEYRNLWIDTCTKFVDDSLSFGENEVVCKDFNQKTENYLETSRPNFYDKIEKPITAATSLCEQINGENLTQTLQEWFLTYNEIMLFVPDFQVESESLILLNEQFSLQVDATIIKFEELYTKKTDLLGMWYIFKYDL